jgi:hypothetical protein
MKKEKSNGLAFPSDAMIQNRSQTPHVFRWLAESSTLYMYRISQTLECARLGLRSRVRPVAAKWRVHGRRRPHRHAAHAGRVRAAGLPPAHAQHAACFAVYSETHYIYKYIKYIYIYTNGSPWSAGTLHHVRTWSSSQPTAPGSWWQLEPGRPAQFNAAVGHKRCSTYDCELR